MRGGERVDAAVPGSRWDTPASVGPAYRAVVRILFLAAEAAPLVKVGGLGDVAGSLPRALRALGHDVRVVIPGYGAIDWPRYKPELRTTFPVPHRGGAQVAEIYETAADGDPVFLVTGPPIPMDRRVYGSGIEEDGPKFIFFSLAALWSCQALGWKPDVVHAHDFHAGAAAYWLGTEGRRNDYYRTVASLFTIHNLPYMGTDAAPFLADYGLEKSGAVGAPPDWARDSLLALALLHADRLSTVSPTYAREILGAEFGRGLEGILSARADRLSGILNGIDTKQWDPARDPALREKYDRTTLGKRAANKVALQKELGLQVEPRAPLIGAVSRLDPQKGFDIAAPAVARWAQLGGQFALLGTGLPALEREYALIERQFPGRAMVRLTFDGDLARRIYAGADMLLIPSRYEPCGLTQMIGMRYGAVPVARRTGGLADTVTDLGEPGATGVLFDEYAPAALAGALERALRVYSDPPSWTVLQRRGMEKDFSWTRSAGEYAALYAQAVRDRAA